MRNFARRISAFSCVKPLALLRVIFPKTVKRKPGGFVLVGNVDGALVGLVLGGLCFAFSEVYEISKEIKKQSVR